VCRLIADRISRSHARLRSPLPSFENEFGRHVALFHPRDDFPAVRRRIADAGGELVEPLRATPFERLFFREPINGYLFELIDRERHRQILEERS